MFKRTETPHQARVGTPPLHTKVYVHDKCLWESTNEIIKVIDISKMTEFKHFGCFTATVIGGQ